MLCFMRNFAACFARGTKHLFALTPFLFLSYFVIAQTRVTGKVTGPDSKAVFGATVAVKGTTVATTTSADGTYSIVMPPNADVLVFSYVGYEVSEVNMRGKNSVDIVMKAQSTTLNEVVVIGYGTQKKKDITGAVSVINVNNLRT